MIRRSRIPTLSPQDVELAEAAADCVSETHHRLAAFLRTGLTLADVDKEVAQILADVDCESCFLNYRVPRTPPFPSHACLSLNECVVHGTHDYFTRPIEPGDLLKIDIGVTHRGFIGDAAWTYSFGEPEQRVRDLMESGKRSLREGVEMLAPGKPLLEWAKAVQRVVEHEDRFHLVRGLGGHGYGRALHEPPFVSNTVPTHPGEWPDAFVKCEPGMLVAVEPMLAIGTNATRQELRSWPIYSADGSMTVHYEADVLVTEDGPRNLTARMWELPDVIDA
ncbi:MAG: methionyl aminopeptidase [Planctomycetota bacterium]